ncbi:HAD family hydrolase [Leptolyngbya sp. AN02str]|uniref:HAD family hydrolase n=1 Tax=Leptolyngbya sp. AN02str TaxID=3423363 RepID=UPI003D31241B
MSVATATDRGLSFKMQSSSTQRFLAAHEPDLMHHWTSPGLSASDLTVFCDFDGPIIDVSERYYQTYQLGLADLQAVYEAMGEPIPIHVLSKTQFWQMKQDRVPDLEIAIRSGLQSHHVDYFLERVTEIVNQPALLHQDRLQPGVRWALSLLRSQGARLILVTLRCQEQALQILESYGLADLFTDIRGTSDRDAAYRNQAELKTRLLAQVIEDHSFSASAVDAAVMVGDTEADILAGQSAGISTIALTCGIRSANYLKRFQPDRIHQDLLSTAHYLIYQQELVRAFC